MKTKNLLSFFPILIVGLSVVMLNMTFAGKIPGTILTISRLALIAAFFVAWKLFKSKQQTNAQNLAYTFMVINLAFLIVSFFTSELWNINLESARGIALMKFSDSFIISIVLIGSLLIGGYKPADIYICKGRLALGLVIGLITFFLFRFFAYLSAETPVESSFIKENKGWILLFVFSNAFMEEILFRGIFMKQLKNYLKPVWAIFLTAVVFAAAHLQVSYTSNIILFALITLTLGMIWGLLIYYTKSIIASVLFHAGSDLMIIFPVYLSFSGSGL